MPRLLIVGIMAAVTIGCVSRNDDCRWAALVVGGFTVAFGRIWEGGIEMIRLGNGHLSYRGLRQQWIQFAPALFVLSAASFSVVAFGVGWWKAWRQHKTPTLVSISERPSSFS